MGPRAQAEHVVSQFEAGGSTYVLVPPAGQPVAIYTQQSRALNLVWALDQLGRLGGKRLVVVGGGVAGATAAAAAAVCGATVVLIEREFQLLTTQLGCHHRFLHPRIHEWPNDKSLMASANLPILNWSLDTAHAVAERLLEGFNAVVRKTNVEVLTGAEVTGFDAETRTVTTRSGGNTRAYAGDVVVFALGFGFDGRFPGVLPRPYWRADALDQPPVRPAAKRAILVVGAGDGAAIDVLRARVRSFDHGPFVDRFLGNVHDTKLRAEVAAADQRALASVGNYAEALNAEYVRLLEHPALIDVWAGIRDQLRKDVDVTWLAPPARPLSRTSFPFNRLLSWLLYHHGEVNFVSGTLSAAQFEASGDNSGGSYRVEYRTGSGQISTLDERVHEVLVRYRTNDVSDPLAHFPGLSRHTSEAAANARLLPEAFDRFAEWSYRQRPPALEAKVVNGIGPVTIKDKAWWGYRLELKVVGDTGARRAQYVLHPEQGEIVRRATAPNDFSTSIFTWDDYWVEAHLSDGTYVPGCWLSDLIRESTVRDTLRTQATILGGEYERTARPKANSRLLDRGIRNELTRAAHIDRAAPPPERDAASSGARSKGLLDLRDVGASGAHDVDETPRRPE